MPALRLFGKKTVLAGDDLHVPCIIAISLRLFQVLVLSVVLIWGATDCRWTATTTCHRSACFWLWIWVGLGWMYGIASVYHESVTLYWSSQGNPVVRTEPRTSQVQRLLERRVSVGSSCLLVLGSIGTTAVWYRATTSCEDASALSWWWILAAALLILTQLGEVGFLWLFLCQVMVIGTTGNRTHHVDEESGTVATPRSTYNHDLAQELWAHRCRFACQCLSYTTCYTFGGQHAAHHSATPFFADVATALADFLESRSVLDLTLTDWMSGLWVLQRLQRQRVLSTRRRLIAAVNASSSGSLAGTASQRGSRSTSLRQRNSPIDLQREESIENGLGGDENALLQPTRPAWYHLETSSLLTLEELPILDTCARYAKYALAIYTWILYLYDKPLSGPGKLFWRGLYCGERRVREDNLLQSHKHALLLTAGVPEADLVYMQLESSFESNPFCVILDHAWTTVVIAIRGTFSLEDVITDTLVEPVSLEALGQECGFDGRNQYCHGGVLSCARNVYRDLQQRGILDQLILGDDAPYPDYTLRLVGHSLGASTAALLSLMLRPQFPRLQCLCYAPAGCTFTWDLAVACRPWCVSCVLDADLVPRLSVDALRHLRDETLSLIGRIKVPKIELARRLTNPERCCQQFVCCRKPTNNNDEDDDLRRRLKDVLYDEDDVPTAEFHRQLETFSQVQSERLRLRSPVQLYPPGRILLLAKTGESHSCYHAATKVLTCCTISTGAQYAPVWVEQDELNEIVVSPTMGTDHFPNRISSVLERVVDEFLSENKRS